MGKELTPSQINALREAVGKEVTKRRPTAGLVGTSGTGKSFTVNVLFGTDLPTSDTVPCTEEFTTTDLRLRFTRGEAKDERVRLRVVDAPGLGESIKRDREYIRMYREHLPSCDVILWLLTARNRALALHERYLKQLEAFWPRMLFGLNAVDLVEPRTWNERINLPREVMSKNIEIIAADRRRKLSRILGRPVSLVPFSAKRRYRLQELFTAILAACPPERAWIFDGMRNFEPCDFVPEERWGEIAKKVRKE